MCGVCLCEWCVCVCVCVVCVCVHARGVCVCVCVCVVVFFLLIEHAPLPSIILHAIFTY